MLIVSPVCPISPSNKDFIQIDSMHDKASLIGRHARDDLRTSSSSKRNGGAPVPVDLEGGGDGLHGVDGHCLLVGGHAGVNPVGGGTQPVGEVAERTEHLLVTVLEVHIERNTESDWSYRIANTKTDVGVIIKPCLHKEIAHE